MTSRVLDDVAPIPRDSVETRVARTLRHLIVTGVLAEGTPLVQRDLAERLQVSQTPVRVALGDLQRAGLVDVGRNGRARVSPLTREDFEEIYAARLGLEGLAARVGAAAVGEPELGRMRSLLRTLERLARERDVDEYLRSRWEFHTTCYRASGRGRLVAEVERLFWRSERYNRLVLSTAKRFRESLANYRRFYDACAAGDEDAAERVIHESMRWAVDLVLPSLPSEAEAA